MALCIVTVTNSLDCVSGYYYCLFLKLVISVMKLFKVLCLLTLFVCLRCEFSDKMFSSTSSKQTNKQDTQPTTTTTTTDDAYTKNLEIFAKRVINFFSKECKESVNNKQPCLLLREINMPAYLHKQFSEDFSLEDKQTTIQEFFDVIQDSQTLYLERNNFTILKEEQISIFSFWKTISDHLPLTLLVSYALFCVLVAYVVLKATFHRLSVLSSMFSLFLFTFLVSVPYEYMRLFHQAMGERNAKLSQTIPSECLSRDGSYWHTFLSQFSFHDDHCLEWHLALTSSPLLMVSPASAFSVAFTKFFTGPFVEVSRTFSKAFSVLLIDIPFQWQIPLVAIFVLILLVLICIGFGYSFNFTPFISMRPTRNVGAPLTGIAMANIAPNLPQVAEVVTQPLEKQSTPPIKLELTINAPGYTGTSPNKMLELDQSEQLMNIKQEVTEDDKENIPPNIEVKKEQ